MSELNPFGVFPSASFHPSALMTRPADLDAASLTNASGAQLDHWITAVNQALPKKALIKTGTVDVRRRRLADFFNIDLSSLPAAPSVGPVSRDAEINKRQWEHLRSLGAEWAEKDTAFRLVPEIPSTHLNQSLLPRIRSAIAETLARTGAASSLTSSASQQAEQPMDDETVQALLKSAADGDMQALVSLFKVQATLSGTSNTAITNPGLTTVQVTPTAPSVSLPTPPTTLPDSNSVMSSSSDSAILLSGNLAIEALKKADGLRDVIRQLENGDVARIRDLYGPKRGREANPLWNQNNLRGTINRRERVGKELRETFGGDKEKFFEFFTIPDDEQPAPAGKKRKNAKLGERLRPVRLVAEAIPHCERDLNAAKGSPEYQHNGEFLEELWERKWVGMNKWEIWRAIGKEDYPRN
ncbi:hypothetical protein R3P38DRAFT_3223598 [Favolaschia claudopus]|uniref:Uncharacterized protein n=1 Tax=Favolaschia claudopus TaxID=2862362 RepID=A0AAV9ZYA1_9AGAR